MPRWIVLAVLGLIILPAATFALWTWLTLNYAYSTGERVGYLQKVSRKGWICKTWEGELAMSTQPGIPPQIFHFSIRDEAVAQKVSKASGQRVRLTYDQHRGVPTDCFGETDYFVTGVETLPEK